MYRIGLHHGTFLTKQPQKLNVFFFLFSLLSVIMFEIILTSLLFPITIIGFITLIIGMIINNYELVYLSISILLLSIFKLFSFIYLFI